MKVPLLGCDLYNNIKPLIPWPVLAQRIERKVLYLVVGVPVGGHRVTKFLWWIGVSYPREQIWASPLHLDRLCLTTRVGVTTSKEIMWFLDIILIYISLLQFNLYLISIHIFLGIIHLVQIIKYWLQSIERLLSLI